jgi:hypothetical protein
MSLWRVWHFAACVLVLAVATPGSSFLTAIEPDGIPVPPELDAAVREYMCTRVQAPNAGGTVFCTYKVAGVDTSGRTMSVYLRATCAEYHVSNGLLVRGACHGMTIALHAGWSESGYTVFSHERPTDGEGTWSEKFNRIFPERYHAELWSRREGWDPLKELEEQARAFYGATAHSSEELLRSSTPPDTAGTDRRE